ncbi:helix-turn-helix domain-containing protein [Streptomyces olivaceoviridis]
MDARVIGRRIAYWRERRRLTQSDLGALMGKSRRTIQAPELGDRQADPRLSVLEESARALRMPLEWLLRDGPETASVDPVELEAIRAVLQRYDVIAGCAEDDGGAGRLDVAALRRRVAHGWDAFQAGAIGSLGRLVPDLITEANRAAARHTGDDQLAAYLALSMALCLAEATAIKVGSGAVAYLAGHRAVIAAERSGAPVIMATAARHHADAMTHHGQPAAAAEFATAAAARLAPESLRAGPEGLSTLGALYLKAAMAQATAAEQADSRRAAAATRAVPGLLDQADEYAEQLGDTDHNALWSAFGAANVALYRLAAHVQLAERAEGVDVALGMTKADVAGLPRERRAHRLVNLAHAYTLDGQREQAVTALLDAETEAREEVLRRPRTHQLVQDLSLLGVGRAEECLRALAGRCGLPG